MRRIPLLCCLFGVLAGCRDGGGGITDIDSGFVAGQAFLDRNGNGVVDGDGDGPAAGVAAALVLDASSDTIARGTTRADGTFLMANVPAGVYRLVAHRGTLGDSVEVQEIKEERLSVIARDTARSTIIVGFPIVSVAAARDTEAGRRVIVTGIALNSREAFGDSTVHVLDATGAMVLARVTGAVAAGDSVRFLGSAATRLGQPVLTSVTASVIRAGAGVQDPDSISTTLARTAAEGALDAHQVHVGGEIVGSETLPTSDVLLTIDDGTGSVQVLFDRDVTFNPGPYVPGALLDATGVLVPVEDGTWQLKPRSADDVTATFPTVTIPEARALPAGRTVYVRGIALNSWVTFGDSTVHVASASVAIRVIRVPPSSVFAGDSIRLLGTTAVRNGQPVLTGQSSAVLRSAVGLPPGDSLSTAVAGTADGGVRDAHQAVVAGTVSAIEQTPQGDLRLTIDDGTGPLVIVLDQSVGFASGAFSVGNSLRAGGVLLPSSTGTTWELKPRTVGEVSASGS